MRSVFFEGINNIGDELNRYIWPQLFEPQEDDISLMAIGTLLDRKFSAQLNTSRHILVFGTGAGYGTPPAPDERWHFYGVRGLKTCQAMGLDHRLAATDAAYTMATLDWSAIKLQAPKDVVVIPHHASLNYIDWETICSQAGLKYLPPTTSPVEFFSALANARLVIAEAMHGAILADIMRIPWISFEYGQQFLGSKWQDWLGMFDMTVVPNRAPAFYDPMLYNQDKSWLFHKNRMLKSKLARYGIGKAKWKTAMLPHATASKAGDRLIAFLQMLSTQNGYLSSATALDNRVSDLYERFHRLAGDWNLTLLRSQLDGHPLELFQQHGFVAPQWQP